ncbi:MAG: metallophosphoesterase [Acidobacteria bacterium]|nr:metallophosphoesterase [Acidobacteriota bacterium]
MRLERNERATHHFLTVSQFISHIVATMLVLLFVQASSHAQAPPAGAVECAKESERCNFSGTGDVSYGAGDKWITKTATDGINCGVAAFGKDPAPNVLKTCKIVAVARKCADEGGVCGFTGTRTIRYGANGIWAEKVATGAIFCGVAGFGRDPVPNVLKQCYIAPPTIPNKLSSFNMIFASDPQYAFCESKACKEGPKDSKTANQWHSLAIGKLGIANPDTQGVVINGDLTNAMRWEHIDVFESLYASKYVIYPGLGNHDYQNYTAASNDTIWGPYDGNATSPHGTLLNLLQYFAKTVRANKNIQGFDWNDSGYWDKSGSLAYYWDVGDYRFVQLNNFPPFAFKFSNFASRKAGNENFDIQSSLPWLRTLLSKSKDKKVVLNMHSINSPDCFGMFDVSPHKNAQDKWVRQPGAYSQLLWLPGAYEFGRLLGENLNVVAIFAGHVHNYVGDQVFNDNGTLESLNSEYSTYDRRDANNQVVAGKAVPVLFSGSAEYNMLLSVKFEPTKITAQPYRTLNGNATSIGTAKVINVR